MDADDIPSAGIEPITDLLVALVGQGALILDHMARHENPDAPPIPVVLRELLRATLLPLEERYPAASLAATAEVLLDIQRTIGEEIYLVDADQLDAGG